MGAVVPVYDVILVDDFEPWARPRGWMTASRCVYWPHVLDYVDIGRLTWVHCESLERSKRAICCDLWHRLGLQPVMVHWDGSQEIGNKTAFACCRCCHCRCCKYVYKQRNTHGKILRNPCVSTPLGPRDPNTLGLCSLRPLRPSNHNPPPRAPYIHAHTTRAKMQKEKK